MPLQPLKDDDHIAVEIDVADPRLSDADTRQEPRSGATASRIEMLPAATSGSSG